MLEVLQELKTFPWLLKYIMRPGAYDRMRFYGKVMGVLFQVELLFKKQDIDRKRAFYERRMTGTGFAEKLFP